MYDLTRLSLKDMTECSAALRRIGTGSSSMETVARSIVGWLYENVGDGQGGRAFAMVRFYKTHAFGALPAELQEYARGALARESYTTDEMKCLTLLGTVGDEPRWNDRKESAGHQAIPLPSPSVVSQLPMIAQLVKQLGLDISALVEADTRLMLDYEQRTFNVFHVPAAKGSPHIPAQDEFVVPYRIESVLGFGGVLPSADLFSVIMFSRVPIPHETAELFKPLALSAKLAVLPFGDGAIFA